MKQVDRDRILAAVIVARCTPLPAKADQDEAFLDALLAAEKVGELLGSEHCCCCEDHCTRESTEGRNLGASAVPAGDGSPRS